MLNHVTSLGAILLRLTIFFSCCSRAQSVLAENITIDDVDLSILYQPAHLWHSSLENCSTCLKLGTPAGLSYHECTYPDESGQNPATSKPLFTTTAAVPQATPNTFVQTSPLSTASVTVPAAKTSSIDVSESRGGRSGKPTGGKSHEGGPEKRTFRPGVVISNVGLHDQNHVSQVTVSFNFTGSALYVFGIQPRGVADDGAPTNMNLSFTLDNQPSGGFHSAGNLGATGFNPGVPVFIKMDLEESPHHFIAHVGRNSTFLLDYIIYTSVANTTVDSTTTTQVSPTGLPQSAPSSGIDPKTKKHNVATFAAAVGGSVGVLGVFSMGLAISIIRRRRKAARRDRLESQSESLQANGSDNSPRMFGPAPFIPRYFPDTIIPTDPPTYTAALATNPDNSTLLASIAPRGVQTSAHRSYADIPPASPPPPLDDLMVPPPPPFPVAVSVPFQSEPPPPPLPEGAVTPLLPEALHPQTENSTISSSHIPDPVFTAASNPNSAAPELSLHHDALTVDGRPLSRLSSSSLRSQIPLSRSGTRTSCDHPLPPNHRPHRSEDVS